MRNKNKIILISFFIGLIALMGGSIYYLTLTEQIFVQRVSSDCSYSYSSSFSVPSGTAYSRRANSNQQLEFNLVWDATGEDIGIRGVIQQGQSHTFGSSVAGVWEDFHVDWKIYICTSTVDNDDDGIQACATEGQSCGFSTTALDCCLGFDCQFFGCVSVGTCNNGDTTCGIIGDPDRNGDILYKCIDSTWKSQGRVEGKCGYNQACATEGQSCGFSTTAPDCCSGFDCQFFGCVKTSLCNEGAIKCGSTGEGGIDIRGEILYKCISSTWKSQGRVDGKCGFTECGIVEDSCLFDSDCCSPLFCDGSSCIEIKAFNNFELITELNKKQRPISGGLKIITIYNRIGSSATCTLGGVIELLGKEYIITAEHCITENLISNDNDIGNTVIQGNQRIGEVFYVVDEKEVDIALILIDDNIERSTKTFLGHRIVGFEKARKGMEVFKIGITTGLTEGIITDESILAKHSVTGIKFRTFEIAGENFVSHGDSGSLVITKNKPHRIVGVLIMKGDNNYGYAQHIEDIISDDKLREFLK